MPEQHEAPTLGWVPAWADLQGRSAEPAGAGFILDAAPGTPAEGAEYVAGWPGPDSEDLAGTAAGRRGARLTLIVAATAGEVPSPPGFSPAAERTLLSAPTAQLNTGVDLPENSQVALAPMDSYDAVEITIFDHPVARGRIQVRDEAAAVAILEVPEGPDKEVLTRALFAAMAEEAFLHGAAHLHMVVEPDAAAGFQESGWTTAGRLLGFAAE
jgi:hypothetical protein